MKGIDVIIGAGWIAFLACWLIMAATAKARKTRRTHAAGIRAGYNVVIMVLIRLHVFNGHGPARDPWLLGTGLAIFLIGLTLALRARMYLGRNWGTPMSRQADPELITTGPYGRIRHPIYTGVVLALAGTAMAVNLCWLIAVAVLTAYYLLSAVIEERSMIKLFPLAYPPYKRATKMLIPFVL
jgi:protein-S-isoprenylcysteine O-methyltransferase Ste14